MLMRLLTHRWFQIVVLMLLLGELVVLRLQDPAYIHRWRQMTFDTYNQILPRPAGQGAKIVDIDEDSLRRYGQWPWPRPLVAKLSEKLHEMGAKVVAFDIVFSEPDRTSPPTIARTLPKTPETQSVIRTLEGMPDNDRIFADKIAQLGNIVTGFSVAERPTVGQPVIKAQFLNEGMYPAPLRFVSMFSSYAAPLEVIGQAAAGSGSFTALPEQDGVVRQVPLLIGHSLGGGRQTLYPALSIEALRIALDKTFFRVKSFGQRVQQGYGIQNITVGDYTVPVDKSGNFYVYYSGHRPDLYVPAWKVLEGTAPESAVKDKIVFVGTSAIGLKDLRASPLNAVLPGVEVHAEIIEQILGGQFLSRPDFFNGAELCGVVLVSLLIVFMTPFVGLGPLSVFVLSIVFAACVGSLSLYQEYGYLFDPVYPSVSVMVMFILSAVLTNLRTEMERRAVKEAFSHYISPDFMEEISAHPEKLKLGGEVRELSVMFTDIRNFTTISESMPPEDLIRTMNDFLTPMTSCVLENRGTIDKYMGDAMMAFWNAPLADVNHAADACRTALQMRDALRPVNQILRDRAQAAGRPFYELKAGIGIHSGPCAVGNMGSKQRFAYSALGDTVNLASRLEGQTKHYGISVMVSAATLAQAPGFAAVEVDLLAVKGREAPEAVYALLGDPESAKAPGFAEFAANHAKMLAAYRAQSWDEALAMAEVCERQYPDLRELYDVYRHRIADVRAGVLTLPADWQGVWVAKEK